jgi:hypothetical protein
LASSFPPSVLLQYYQSLPLQPVLTVIRYVQPIVQKYYYMLCCFL